MFTTSAPTTFRRLLCQHGSRRPTRLSASVQQVLKAGFAPFSSEAKPERGPSQSFIENTDKLAEAGISFGEHALKNNLETLGRTGECPFLSEPENEYIRRTAERESNARVYLRKFPIAIAKAQGIHVYDTEGREYLDCLQCAGTLALGHNHPVMVDAVMDFMQSGAPQQTMDLVTPVKDDYVSALMEVTPPELDRIHFCSPAGTDALDAAVKLCKIATGRRTVLAFHGAYHGQGHGTMAMMGNLGPKTPVPSLMTDVHFVPYPYSLRNPFGMRGYEGEAAVLAYLTTVLSDEESGIPKPACLVMEAIQGEGGVNPMSSFALREVRRITAEAGVPLVVDEVQAGFCRSGDFFAFQHGNRGAPSGTPPICPDVMCVSKAAGGSFPLAAILYRQELDKWATGAHTGTFRGNQIAFAAGTASIRYMQEERLWDRVSERGAQFVQGLHAIASKPSTQGRIREIRGRGLMLGVEFTVPAHEQRVEVDVSGVPMPDGVLTDAVQLESFRRGLLLARGGRRGGVVRFLPPLTITEEEVDECLRVFGDAVEAAVAANP